MKKNIDKGYPYRDRGILIIDLSNDEYSYTTLSKEEYKEFHGGRALAYKLWDTYADLKTINKKCLYIGAPIIFTLGAGADIGLDYLSSSTILTYSLSSKSLISNNFSSLKFSKALYALGICAIVIKGRSRRLSKIELYEEEIKIGLCEELHNFNTNKISEMFNSSLSLISIGKSGESRLDYSSIYIDSNNVGRYGLGASFGEKNIKVIAFNINSNGTRVPYYEKLTEDVNLYFNSQKDVNYLEYANKLGWAAIEGFKYRYDPRLWGLGSEITKECNLDWLMGLALGSNLGIYDYRKVKKIESLCLDLALDPFSISIYLLWIFEAEKKSIIDIKIDKDINYIDRIILILTALTQNKISFSKIKERVNKLSSKFGFEENNFTSLERELLPLDLRALNAFSLSLMVNDDTIVPWELFKKINKSSSSKALLYSQIYREICESLGLSWKSLLHVVSMDCSYRNNKNNFLKTLVNIFSISEGYRINEEELLNFGKKTLLYRRKLEAKVNKNINYSTSNIPLYFSTVSKSNHHDKNVVSIAEELEKYLLYFQHEISNLDA